MRLVIVSHKRCWYPASGDASFTTDGGFPFQIRAISELFDETRVLVPCRREPARPGAIVVTGRQLSIIPLSHPIGRDLWRKLTFPFWLVRNLPRMVREIKNSDVVHAAIPGDVGMIGALAALMLRKPLFVRHCGNWLHQVTLAERFCRWLMERAAGGTNVMFATGGGSEAPSKRNPAIRWIFSSTLSETELTSLGEERDAPCRGRARLIIAGRQEREKGTGLIIQSLPVLIPDLPGVSLDVLGDGAHLSEFKALAASLNVADRVRFHGNVDHATLLARFRGADVFCFPTTASEGFPKVVLEAMACGLPVVTTGVSVLPFLVNDCGIVLRDVSPQSLATAVLRSVADCEGYRAMSRQARRTARMYSLERWRDTIGVSLESAWGPLRSHA